MPSLENVLEHKNAGKRAQRVNWSTIGVINK